MSIGEGWERVATLLIARRVALGYPRRSDFVRVHQLKHSRTVDDLENARRENYEPATLAHMELIYGWKPGSIRTVVGGGEPAEAMPPRRAAGAAADPHDQLLRRLGDALEDPEIPEHLRAKLAARLQYTYDQWLELVRATAEAGRDPEPSGDEQPAPSRRT